MNLKCDSCGKEAYFEDEKAAYQAGWDFPPMCGVTTCGACPSAPLILPTENQTKDEPGQRSSNA